MRILILTTLLILSGSASAGLYKWVDDDGNVHYSQKPPRDQQFERLKEPPPAPEEPTPLYKSKAKKHTQNTQTTTAAESAKNAEMKHKNCENAKKRLNVYQVYRRVRDDKGDIKVLSDAERDKQIREAKQAISDFCN